MVTIFWSLCVLHSARNGKYYRFIMDMLDNGLRSITLRGVGV